MAGKGNRVVTVRPVGGGVGQFAAGNGTKFSEQRHDIGRNVRRDEDAAPPLIEKRRGATDRRRHDGKPERPRFGKDDRRYLELRRNHEDGCTCHPIREIVAHLRADARDCERHDLAHAFARKLERARQSFFAVLGKLREDRREKLGRWFWFGYA